jgi:hypothetical protein
MRSPKSSVLFVVASTGLVALAFTPGAAAKPEPVPSWKVARPRLACGADAGGGVSACRIEAAVTRAPGAADRGVVTVVALDPAGRALGCWNGGGLAGSSAGTRVHVLAPSAELGKVRAFELFVSSWGCWGTPDVLGPRVRIQRASAAEDAAVVDEAREALRQQRDDGEADDHEDPSNGLEHGPVVPWGGRGGADGC